MGTKTKKELVDKLVKVTVALSELYVFVDKNKFALDLFEKSIQTTSALPVSLDEFVAEWQAAVNNAILDSAALFECWKKSVRFYKDLTIEEKKLMHLDDVGVESNDLVFEDGSYITCGVIKYFESNDYELRFYVELGRDSTRFKAFDDAAKWLWDNHSKEGYGV